MQNISTSVHPSDNAQAYSRIRKIGKIGRAICTFLMVLLCLVTIAIGAVLLLHPEALGNSLNMDVQIFFQKVHVPFAADIPVALKWGASVAVILVVFVDLAVIWFMRSIFQLFATGEVFTLRCASRIKWLGCLMLGAFFLNAAGGLFPGLFLIAFGMVLEIASTIKQENDLTV